MPDLQEFCTIEAEMTFETVGKTPAGYRMDIPFKGTARGPHWEGERPVAGIDHVTIRGDGHMSLHLHARIGEGAESVSYRGGGISLVPERGIAEPRELLEFETASEELAFLNTSIGVGIGRGEGSRLLVTVYVVGVDAGAGEP